MSEASGLVLIGFGGHARSIADVAISAGFSKLLFVDENARAGETFLNFPVQAAMPSGDWLYFPAAGDNRRRMDQFRELKSQSLPIASIISPTATIGAGAKIATGCFIGHHAHAGPMARIGMASILNTGAIVEHDCVIGDCVHVSIGSRVAGVCKVGNRVFLGAGAIVIDHISIASDVTVGAGGVVIAAIDLPGVYAGVPVRRIGD